MKDFLAVADNAFLKVELVNMEAKVLAAVGFKLCHVSALVFFKRFSRVAEQARKEYYFGVYLIELVQLHTSFGEFKNSLIACACIQLTNKIFNKPEWPDKLKEESGYTLSEVRQCGKALFIMLLEAEERPISSIKRKYSSTELYEVASYKFERA